ncbi:MAG: hypothetical protein M3N21_00070 [Actinomycetota bacterium]|nr:hypothetical protein [Actinomycetota bacterium]
MPTNEFILELEQSLPVAQWRFGDVDLWPVARQLLWLDSHARTAPGAGPGMSHPLRALAVGNAAYLRARWQDRVHEASLRGCADVVLLSGGALDRIPRGPTWYDRHCDPLVDVFELEGARCVQLDPHHLYRTPRYRPSLLIQPRLDWWKIRSRFGTGGGKTLSLPGHDEVVARSVREGATAALVGRRRLLTLAVFMDQVATFVQGVVEAMGARLLVLLDWNAVSQACVVGARRAGSLSVELQHGVHGHDHPHYGQWADLPAGGYSTHPDVYWMWEDTEAMLPDWARPGQRSRVLVGGNPWMSAWQGQGWAAPRLLGAPGPQVLVTLQPGLDGPGHLAALHTAMATSPASWTWLVRHHPRTDGPARVAVEKRLRATGARIDVGSANALPIPALVQQVDAHVTVSSSSVCEARELGLGSVVLDEVVAHEVFAAQVASGDVLVAATAEELLAAVATLCARGRRVALPQASPQSAVKDLLGQVGRP